jgi:protein-tyrosine phosphatase
MKWSTAPYPAHDLIIEPDVPVAVTRRANDHLHIQWQAPGESVTIYASTNPEETAWQQLLTTVKGTNEVVLTDLDPAQRFYFKLVFGDGRSLTTAERVLPLKKAVNFRDLGGYGTEDGRFVKWGHIYRAGNLHGLSTADQEYLQQLDLKLVCDLRSARASRQRPDRFLPDLARKQHHLPMRNPSRLFGLQAIGAALFRPSALNRLMVKGYIKLVVEGNAAVIAATLEQLAHPDNLPCLIHCAAGKDRTGVVIALLLTLLGVPEATIIADYSLSNAYYDHFARAIEPIIRPFIRWSFSSHSLYPLHIAHPQTLQDTFAYIREEYGSILSYLSGRAGLKPQTMNQIRANLLE